MILHTQMRQHPPEDCQSSRWLQIQPSESSTWKPLQVLERCERRDRHVGNVLISSLEELSIYHHLELVWVFCSKEKPCSQPDIEVLARVRKKARTQVPRFPVTSLHIEILLSTRSIDLLLSQADTMTALRFVRSVSISNHGLAIC